MQGSERVPLSAAAANCVPRADVIGAKKSSNVADAALGAELRLRYDTIYLSTQESGLIKRLYHAPSLVQDDVLL